MSCSILKVQCYKYWILAELIILINIENVDESFPYKGIKRSKLPDTFTNIFLCYTADFGISIWKKINKTEK